MKKTAIYILNFGIVNDIGTLVCGYNPDFKCEINLGKTMNQNFTQINFVQKIQKSKNSAVKELNGICINQKTEVDKCRRKRRSKYLKKK